MNIKSLIFVSLATFCSSFAFAQDDLVCQLRVNNSKPIAVTSNNFPESQQLLISESDSLFQGPELSSYSFQVEAGYSAVVGEIVITKMKLESKNEQVVAESSDFAVGQAKSLVLKTKKQFAELVCFLN